MCVYVTLCVRTQPYTPRMGDCEPGSRDKKPGGSEDSVLTKTRHVGICMCTKIGLGSWTQANFFFL